MFEGLVFDEAGNPAEVAWVGDDACYVVRDDDFRRHIEAASVDRQVLQHIKQQVAAHKDLAVSGVLEMLGKDDLFTKVAVESSIDQMDQNVGQPIPEEARQLLGMMGFRIVINIHGDVISVEMPAASIDDDDL